MVLHSVVRWECQVCGEHIQPESGGLYVDRARAEELVQGWSGQVDYAPQDHMDWSVVHHQCAGADRGTMQVFVDDVTTVLELMGVTATMADNLWLYATDWPKMLALGLDSAKPSKVYPTIDAMFDDLEAQDRDNP